MQNATKKWIQRTGIYTLIASAVIFYMIMCYAGLGFPCLIYKLFNVRCISCGATTAGLAILRLDFATAFESNALFTIIIYPAIFLLVLQDYIYAIMGMLNAKEYRSLIDKIFETKNKLNKGHKYEKERG